MIAALLIAASAPLSQVADWGQEATPGAGPDDAYHLGEIVVTPSRPRGAAATDIPPEISFDAEQLRSFGASDIPDLLIALEPQTRSTRGSGPPITLLNGRRVSGAREIRGVPAEAIERVDILPEQVALAHGYQADQRVVNFVLKPRFSGLTLELGDRRPGRGGHAVDKVEVNGVRIQPTHRWTFSLEGRNATPLFETERDIRRDALGEPFDLRGNITGLGPGGEIDPALTALVGSVVTAAGVPIRAAPGLADFAATAGQWNDGDLTAYRTLSPRRRDVEVSAALARDLNATTAGSISLGFDADQRLSYRGLPGARLILPGGGASPFGGDVVLNRYFDAAGTLTRQVDSRALEAGVMVQGFIGDWRWTLNGAYDRTETETRTGRGLDVSALQEAVSAGRIDPFGDPPKTLLTARPRDRARSVASIAGLDLVLNGVVRETATGALDASIRLGLDRRDLGSESLRSGVAEERALSRDRASVRASFNLPLAARRRDRTGPAAILGDLSANLNLAREELSDFGGLDSLGLGFNWSPVKRLSFLFSYTDQKSAPSVQQLNDPTVATPGVQVFDFAVGQTVDVIQITGGAPGMEAEHKRTLQLGANLSPFARRSLRFSVNYTRTEVSDAIMGFPTLTPDLEAALPERFVRNGQGALVSIDARPLNFARTEKQEIRWGMNFSTAFGSPAPVRDEGAISADGRPSQGERGQFRLSIHQTWRLRDRIGLRDDLPTLDLLDGAATGSQGGQPRQDIQFSLGASHGGLGGALNANWQAGTRVARRTARGGGPDGQDLRFSDLAIVNLNLFADLSPEAAWTRRFGWLRGARVSLGIDNLFDARMRVTTGSGETPLNYQPDTIDPMGRMFRLDLRKLIF